MGQIKLTNSKNHYSLHQQLETMKYISAIRLNFAVLLTLILLATDVCAFSVNPPQAVVSSSRSTMLQHHGWNNNNVERATRTQLHMSSSATEKTRTTKKSILVKDRTETKAEEEKKKEEMWRVVLHNDEVHTFNYVIRSLCKVIGTLDRKAAFEICVQTHGIGKATVTKTWKKQAEQFCLGLQRQGLTVSISPDKDFEGGHSGGGL